MCMTIQDGGGRSGVHSRCPLEDQEENVLTGLIKGFRLQTNANYSVAMKGIVDDDIV